MKLHSLLVAGLLALSLAPLDQPIVRGEGIRIGCMNIIETERITETTANELLSLPIGSSFKQLVQVAYPNCTLKQTFGKPGVPNYSVFAYGVSQWGRCYVRVELSWSKVTSIRKVCL